MLLHVVFDGVADGPLGVALELVGTAARLVRAGLVPGPVAGQALAQQVVSIDGRPVKSAAGRPVAVDGPLRLQGLRERDVLVLPGLGAVTESQIAALLERPDIVRGGKLLAAAAMRGIGVAASCSATFVLAASGALEGRQATTTWWLGSEFARRFPGVSLRAEQMVVESGGVFTAGAALAHADLVLAILSRRVSPSLAHLVARYLVLDERSSQARYMVMEHLRSAAPEIRELEAFVNANLERQLTLDELARATATSKRTLARRLHQALGMTPQRFVQRLRVARAVHLLETTAGSVEEISARVGYEDAAAFRRVFRRELGESPRGRRGRASPVEAPRRGAHSRDGELWFARLG